MTECVALTPPAPFANGGVRALAAYMPHYTRQTLSDPYGPDDDCFATALNAKHLPAGCWSNTALGEN